MGVMRLTTGVAASASILVGIILSLVGMLSNTGLMKLNLPTLIMYIGYLLLIGGMIVLYAVEKFGFGQVSLGPDQCYVDNVPDRALSTISESSSEPTSEPTSESSSESSSEPTSEPTSESKSVNEKEE